MKLSGIFNDFLNYLGSLVTEKAFLLVSLIIAARLIGPVNYGAWTVLSLILLYGAWIHFGIANALRREIPFYIGKNYSFEAEEIKNIAFSSIMLITISIAFVFFLSVIFLRNRLEPAMTTALLLIPSILILQQIYDNARHFLTAINNFRLVSRLKIIRAFATSILILILVSRFNFIGIPMGLLGGYFVSLTYICRRYAFEWRPLLNIKKSISLLKIGFVIAAAMLMFDFFITIDRLLVYRLMGKVMLGYYSIASNLFDFSILVPTSLGTIVFINLARRYGEKERICNLRDPICLCIQFLAYIIPMIIMITYLFLPYAVAFILPQYAPGIRAAQVASLGLLPLSISIIYSYTLVVINKQLYCLMFFLLALTIKWVLIHILIISGKGIEGVALGSTAVYILFSIFILLYMHSHFKEAILSKVKFILQVYLPFAYLLLVLWSSHWLGQKTAILMSLPLGYLLLNFLRAQMNSIK